MALCRSIGEEMSGGNVGRIEDVKKIKRVFAYAIACGVIVAKDSIAPFAFFAE